MKLYNTTELKLAIQRQNPDKDKEAISMFFGNKNYYEHFALEKVYFDNVHLNVNYIEEDFVLKLVMLAKLNIGLSINLNKIPFVKFKPTISVFNCKGHQQYLEISKLKYREVLETVKNRKLNKIKDIAYKLTERASLDFNVDNTKIMSLDFEFFGTNAKIDNVSEAGIAISNKGEITYNHYIIKEPEKMKSDKKLKLQSKFNFGSSIHITQDELKVIIMKELHNTNYLVSHSINSESNILKRSSIKLDHLKLLDTTDLQRNFKKIDKATLKNHLTYHEISFHHLHNAGNDAAYTLQLVLKMKQKYGNILALNINKPKIKLLNR